MDWREVVRGIATPETVTLLLTIAVALLVKSKVLTERDVAVAREMLSDGGKVSEVTDRTRMVAGEVVKLKSEIEAPAGVKDTTRKKVQRAGRAILRGWLRI